MGACSLPKKGGISKEQIELPTIEIQPEIYKVYNPSRKRKVDILHTRLKVRFDWSKAHLHGKARITLVPYFYPIREVTLDARGFEIHSVSQHLKEKELTYQYNGEQITIALDSEYSSSDTIIVDIEYTAKPNEIEAEGSEAITDAKGLYFINPTGEEKDKPRQIWTQGETESNSCWFPTVDAPNERMSQELYITIDTPFVTLSNGLLIYSSDNGDGTRTDYWKQDLPHAPYLAMMSIGKYAIIRDQWQDIEVSYYVEPEYEPYASQIFGNTPEMLQYYSDLLGVSYPWDKYAQVVVRDYVSGAMENTSAVIFGEFMNKDSRELKDENNEDIIAHELFHHWFGDLVTCESWANIPLNESFATYGEYLWFEYKYGQEEADHHLMMDLNSYLQSAERYQEDLIRFNYNDKEDMFDSHSYAKGGCVLHMLRKYVGDKAFFASLKQYLETNKYKSVEIHDLRLAFEEITGEDLNWFFNQWFLSSGHPNLEFNYGYNDSLKQQSVTVYQLQNLENTPLYSLPISIDIYQGGEVFTHKVTIDSVKQTFVFKVNGKPDLVNVDADKMLLAVKQDFKTKEEWAFQYYNAPLFFDRREAVYRLSGLTNDSLAKIVIRSALEDAHWDIRLFALEKCKDQIAGYGSDILDQFTTIARTDKNSMVRGTAIKCLSEYFVADSTTASNPVPTTIFEEALADPSYYVMGKSIKALATRDESLAFQNINSWDPPIQKKLLLDIAGIYATYGTSEDNVYFTSTYSGLGRHEKYGFIDIYSSYLLNQNDSIINEGLVILEDAASNQPDWWARVSAVYLINTIYSMYDNNAKTLLRDVGNSKMPNHSPEMQQIQIQKETILAVLAKIKEQEKEDKVLDIWEQITP